MQPEGSTRLLYCDAELFVTENDHTHSIYHKSQPRTGHNARTGPETPQAEAQSHTQHSNTRTHTRQTDLMLTQSHLRQLLCAVPRVADAVGVGRMIDSG